MRIETSLDLFLVALVLIACGHDLATRKIPNRIILCGLSCAAALHLASASSSDILVVGLAGAGAGLVVFLPLYCLGAMAAGDVKLMAMVGAFTGPALALEVALASYCAGGVMAVGIALATGRMRDMLAKSCTRLRAFYWRPEPSGRAPACAAPSIGSMPYGVALTCGTLLVLLIRHR